MGHLEQVGLRGSISAHAEEPISIAAQSAFKSVYLRARGGTVALSASEPCTGVYLRARGGTSSKPRAPRSKRDRPESTGEITIVWEIPPRARR